MEKKKNSTATTDKNITDFMDKLNKKKAEMKKALLTGTDVPPPAKPASDKNS